MLVRSYVVGDVEGRVVGGDFSYVAVLAGTEFRVVVAGCGVCWLD